MTDKKGSVPATLKEEAMDEHGISKDRVNQYANVFEVFDEDGSGDIDVDELHKMVIKLKKPGDKDPTKADAQKMLNEVDADGNGEIDFLEFVTLMEKRKPKKADDDPLAEVRAAFRVFDKDGNGTIDREEVAEVLADLKMKIDKEGLDDIMNLVDTDGNGVIDFDEFCEMYRMLGLRGVSALHNDPDAPAPAVKDKPAPKDGPCCIIS